MTLSQGHNQDDQQERVLRMMMILSLIRPLEDWPGSLVLLTCLSPIGAALSRAVHIAGGVALAIEDRPEMCRAALRAGDCDFAVNTLDEALRIVKNEIRKRQPLAVALEAIPHEALEELLTRGIRPELFADVSDPDTHIRFHRAPEWTNPYIPRFHELGTVVVNVDHSLAHIPHPDVLDGPNLLGSYAQANGLNLNSFTFATAAELREFDNRHAKIMPQDDPRRRWSVGAPRHFYRERPYRRAAFLTEAEQAQLEL